MRVSSDVEPPSDVDMITCHTPDKNTPHDDLSEGDSTDDDHSIQTMKPLYQKEKSPSLQPMKSEVRVPTPVYLDKMECEGETRRSSAFRDARKYNS
eukprot:TRINITY_DN12260_c0_g1_i1.p1 TRINITY_DN12260_c0_g1~~TRINITY_DN12260_c0_g1_i1.p1  ORF type:complete len:96 (-),score=6.85 TRINITY_DN12260_c0_g1_i1:68-355(-)